METLYFMLGALSVITIVAVVSVFSINKKVALMVDDRIVNMERDLSDYISDVAGDLEQEVTELHRRIDDLEKHLDSVDDRLLNEVQESLERSIAHTDSRVDKLESNLNAKFNDNTAFVDLLHHRLEDLEMSKS